MPDNPKRLIQIRVERTLYAHIQQAARADQRPMTQWIIKACADQILRQIPSLVARAAEDPHE